MHKGAPPRACIECVGSCRRDAVCVQPRSVHEDSTRAGSEGGVGEAAICWQGGGFDSCLPTHCWCGELA